MTPFSGMPVAASARTAVRGLWVAPWEVAVALLASALGLLGPGNARVPALAAGQALIAREGGGGVEGA